MRPKKPSNFDLAYRAAEYVGMAHKPRTSIPVRNNESVMTIWHDGYVSLYSEVAGHANCEWFLLTPTRYRNLMDALGKVEVA